MKRLGCLLALLVGCAGQVVPPPAAEDYCDYTKVDWGAPDCTIVTAQGTYGDDLRYVCPQADGTEWELRVFTNFDGTHGSVHQRYTTYEGVTPHLVKQIVCIEHDHQTT